MLVGNVFISKNRFWYILSAGVAEHGQRRRTALPKESGAVASGAYPVEVRGFKSHPLHFLLIFCLFLAVFLLFRKQSIRYVLFGGVQTSGP